MKDDKTGFKELIVYYDEDYPTVWIRREVSKKIASFLKSENFVEYAAEDLAKWMEESIKNDTCWRSVVVFSQDVVPDTICHSPEPSSLIREYLDCGGRVVWIGDIPFYYFGPNPLSAKTQYADARLIPLTPASEDFSESGDFVTARSHAYKDRNDKIAYRWGSGACFSILGVMPLYLEFPSSKVSITKTGKSLGLQESWYSIRPIIIKGSDLRNNTVKILATTKPLSLMLTKKTIFRARVRSLHEVNEREISFPSIIDSLSKFLGPIVTIGSALASVVAGLNEFAAVSSLVWYIISSSLFILAFTLWFFRWRERYASAWLKNFDKRHPTSGFLRLWDYRLHRITSNMLKDLYDVALARI